MFRVAGTGEPLLRSIPGDAVEVARGLRCGWPCSIPPEVSALEIVLEKGARSY
ncbi:MAG: hypothetical protein ACLT1W_08670 [Alistipes onderdonkii]